jgi:hypothetical protein
MATTKTYKIPFSESSLSVLSKIYRYLHSKVENAKTRETMHLNYVVDFFFLDFFFFLVNNLLCAFHFTLFLYKIIQNVTDLDSKILNLNYKKDQIVT